VGALTALELCAGAGGQALGLESAGFHAVALVEVDAHACATLRQNRPGWNVVHADLREFDARRCEGVDLVAGGLPCPPFSVAGRQRGADDERDLFPSMFRVVGETRPKAVMIENVRGLMTAMFEGYRRQIDAALARLGYEASWGLFNARAFGVPQHRERVVVVALRRDIFPRYAPPSPMRQCPPTVGDTLHDLMAAGGWEGARDWRRRAADVAPTIVGGSKRHGGPDLGPTRAKRAWSKLGVDGHGVADAAPEPGFQGDPKLTVRMVARLQGFPDDWRFSGSKTHAYRQVGNAFPPPVANAVASAIAQAIASGHGPLRASEAPARSAAPEAPAR
jgi:DNA (cytosine-5)-methyltransferase 1